MVQAEPADRRLLAAAPDLLAALREIAAQQTEEPRDGAEWDADCCSHAEDGHKHGIDIGDWHCGEIARAAIAKAEGTTA